MDYRIFNVGTDVSACDCTRGYTDTVRESALKVDSRRKSLAASGNRTCVDGVSVHQLSNIPNPTSEVVSPSFFMLSQ